MSEPEPKVGVEDDDGWLEYWAGLHACDAIVGEVVQLAMERLANPGSADFLGDERILTFQDELGRTFDPEVSYLVKRYSDESLVFHIRGIRSVGVSSPVGITSWRVAASAR